MKIMINKRKIPINVLYKFSDKFKSFKFKFDEIQEGICFIKKKIVSTYFFCQNVDIIWTDKDFNILKFKKSVKSEKIFISPKNTYYTFIIKDSVINNLSINDKLKTYKN